MDLLLTDPDRKDQMKRDIERKKENGKKKNQTILSMQQREKSWKASEGSKADYEKVSWLTVLTGQLLQQHEPKWPRRLHALRETHTQHLKVETLVHRFLWKGHCVRTSSQLHLTERPTHPHNLKAAWLSRINSANSDFILPLVTLSNPVQSSR